jgi:hypothetical protein
VESGMVLEQFRKMAADRTERAPARPKSDPAKATDRILLSLLLANAEARPQLIEGLRGIASVREAVTATIYEKLISMHDAGEAIGFNSLHERLMAADQERLASIVLDAETTHIALEDGLACIEAVRREDSERARQELKARVKVAEREGRISEALELMQQLSVLP